MTIACTNGPAKWMLKCRGSHWIGIMQSCSTKTYTKTDNATVTLPSPKSVKDAEVNHVGEKYYCKCADNLVCSVPLNPCFIIMLYNLQTKNTFDKYFWRIESYKTSNIIFSLTYLS